MPKRTPYSVFLLPLAALALALALLLLWLWLGWQPQAPAHRLLDAALTTEPAGATGGDFVLQGAAGPTSLQDFRGKLVLLYFGYTACPDVCPTNLALLAMALRALAPAEREQVQVVFVSVDPQRDDPAHLKQFVEYFHPEIIGLTGSEQQLAEITTAYGAVYRRSQDQDSAMGYLIDHSAQTYLIDGSGQLRETLDHATPVERISELIRTWLPRPDPGEAPVVQDAYARAVAPGVANSAAFMRIHNASEQPLALVAASSPVAEVVELHTHQLEAGVMKMRRIEQIIIAPRSETVLEPGGLHLMLIGLRHPLKVGDPVALELTFDRGEPVALTAETR